MPLEYFRTGSTLTACTLLLLCACTTTGKPGNDSTITITSDPAGAVVLADATEIGTTPLTFTPGSVFRSGMTSGSDSLLAYRYIGRLTVRKAGCRDYVTEVDDRLLASDITVQLECDAEYQPPAAATSAPVQRDLPSDAEQRLLRIESLHDKGLISAPEYRELRQRILDTL